MFNDGKRWGMEWQCKEGKEIYQGQGFPGVPVVKTSRSLSRWPGFDP